MHGSKLLIPGVTTTSKGSNSSGLLHLRPLQKPFKRRKDWTNCQTYFAAWNHGLKRNFKKMKSKLTLRPLGLNVHCCKRKIPKTLHCINFCALPITYTSLVHSAAPGVNAIPAIPPPQCTSQNAITDCIFSMHFLDAFS